ncbi:hypothetical protein GWK47_014557 [Chionoecetes opilio]|uniref:Uncharacterized protein n=1 Tax=Chionoecetes opilio TaxID=41210 RepID=A0A8J4XT39_CHIOP|nr:hypothetical protein GWK47_014557 [Chionoecetes opilio]
MVLRHQSLLRERANASSFSLLAVSLVAKKLYEVLRVSTVSPLRGTTKDHRSLSRLKFPNVRTRGRAEAGFEDILEDHLVDMMAAGPNPKASFAEFLLNPKMQAPCTMPCSKPWCRKQKAMILSLTPASSTSFKTTAATFLPVESELAGTPRRNSASSSPVRRTAMRSSVSPERDGRVFRPNAGPTSQVFVVPQFHDLLGGFAFSPKIRARWTVLFETAISPMSIPRT